MNGKPIVVLLALGLAACQALEASTQTIRGSGEITSIDRSVSDFSSVQINLGADLILTQGDGESLTIEADENLMQFIETRIENGRLIASTPNSINIAPSQPIRLNLGFDALNTVSVFGASNITAENLDLDELTINFSGTGSTRLSGTVDEQNIHILGQATINDLDLASRRVIVDISGAGTVAVNATDSLDVRIAGAGTIRYTGDPTISRNITGIGTITPVQ